MTIRQVEKKREEIIRERHVIVNNGKVCGNVSGDWYR